MERWLSKSRVLLGLCGVLLLAALNRHDPMVFGMFLFLAVVSLLGFVLPWLSLRSMTVRLEANGTTDVVEGQGCDLNILVERTAPWPAFMVAIETEWEWASQRLVLSQTVPVIRAGHLPRLGSLVQFPCRGHYELVAVRLSSGFPLGLIRAHHTLSRPQIHLRVLPQPQPVQWPLPWTVCDDPLGELSTRRLGQSFELGMLRTYQHGEAVGRVSWRASARVGELVIQHFQHSGSVRLRVLVRAPHAPALGDPDSSGEQALRLAAGVCQAAWAQGAQVFLYLDTQTAPLHERTALQRALAEALPCGQALEACVARVAQETSAGEQVAVVVEGSCPENALLPSLHALVSRGCQVLVCIALGRRAPALELAQAGKLQRTLVQAGFATCMEKPC